MLSQKVPFSHYSIFIQKDESVDTSELDEPNETETDEPNEPTVIFKEKDNNTAYLKIKNFSTSQKELADVLPKIVKNNYQNLIIDLRDNGGGGLEAAFELAKYITEKEIVVGYFVTNKLQYSGFQLELFQNLPVIKMQSTKEFVSSLKKGKGSKLVFKKNNNPVFLGNLYILTNSNTASTCEPIVYQLKETKRATVIGENTMGAMLSAAYFNIYDKYNLYLPIADFYTYDGNRLEGVGVAPNIETKSENALDKALEIIKNKNE
jgi:C-terminal processing protease CtpA/Prc